MISRVRREGSHARDSAPYNRTLVFFDAIYAFALTLLITTIDPPPADSWRSLDTLLSGEVGTQLLGFAISFVIIASYWRLNVRLVDRITELTVAAHYWWLTLLITGPVFGHLADRAVARLPEHAGNRDDSPEEQPRG